MTVDHFPITQQHNGWLITWPGFRNISRVENKQKLADLIFDSIGAQEARFGVRFKDGETKFLHIRSSDWHAPGADLLDNLLDQYEIAGVLFDSEQSATELQDYLEKRLMWRRLSAQSA
jgi:hypothetical protein